MSFLKKLFNSKSTKSKKVEEQPVELSLDDAFVHHFIKKGGKFLYSISENEISKNLTAILKENKWDKISCSNDDLLQFVQEDNIKIQDDLEGQIPFFTGCEHLISDNGDILFSSNQLGAHKISNITENFIVFAKTSQLVKNTGEGLTGIKTNCKDNIPNNISSVKNYSLVQEDDNFLNYGNNNSKNLYLLLLEDL